MLESSQTNDQAPQPGSDRNPIDALAEAFVARLRQGEYPSISEYASKHPELADEIRTLFPTLAMLERGGEGLTADPSDSAEKQRLPRRLGEYRIIREVGRGGMGIVYQAEHDTMRRQVALKVLPPQATVSDTRLRRFYLEARAAGRLHHTNIVPVFEVGTDRGFHYYAMQFIHGQSLDIVFDELRRLQGVAPETTDAGPTVTPQAVNESLSKSVALHLHSGRSRQLSAPKSDGDSSDAMASREPPSDCHEEAATVVGSGAVDARKALVSVSSSVTLPEDVGVAETSDGSQSAVTAELSNSTNAVDDYFRRVARIGLQIAEALSYAHGQGVLHRDIKPSNIILDTAGVAWVTDFGLAKHDDDGLTRSGDIVGTFRYMAPERFNGHADARSDVYGLGLTLYELCTLRNAFYETDRARLIHKVNNEQPARPRKINPQTPRDLETIILKSIEKQPSHRYQAAHHIAADLRLFLADHPIQARRTSTGERIWRWCRRNPQQAALAACVLFLLMLVTVGSRAFGVFARRQASELARSQQIATVRLYESLRGRAEASRWSGHPGQHFTSLSDLASAVEMFPQLGWSSGEIQRETLQLRNAAIAAMALPDVRTVRTWSVDQPWSKLSTFNPDYSAYAQADAVGNIAIRSVLDDTERSRLPTPKAGMTVSHMQFSPSGEHLAASYASPSGRSLYVWKINSAEVVVQPKTNLDATATFDFDPKNQWIALGSGKTVTTYRLTDGKPLDELQLERTIRGIRVDPWGKQIAALLAGRRTMHIWNLAAKEVRSSLDFGSTAWSFAWHPRTGELAVGEHNATLRLYSASDLERQPRALEGHTSRVTALHFTDSGDCLVSNAWDGTTRLWEVATGNQLLRIEGVRLLDSGFSAADSRFLGVYNRSQFEMWEVALETTLRILRSQGPTMRRWSVDIDPTGRWLASARDDGVEIWEIRSGKLAKSLPAKLAVDGRSKDAEFLPDRSGLLTSNTDGLRFHPIEAPDGPGDIPLRLGPPRSHHPEQTGWVSLTSDGRLAAFRHGIRATAGAVMNLGNPSEIVKLGPHPGVDHVQISPDGRWAATGTWGGRGIHVWDARSGQRVTREPLERNRTKTNVMFSPDSKQLAASTTDHYVAWRVGTWEPIYRESRPITDDWPGPLAYSPDGRMLAAAHSRFVLALLDANTGEKLAVLDAPSEAGFHSCCFSPDGSVLAAASDIDIHLWDLASVRKQLAAINLDWSLPPSFDSSAGTR